VAAVRAEAHPHLRDRPSAQPARLRRCPVCHPLPRPLALQGAERLCRRTALRIWSAEAEAATLASGDMGGPGFPSRFLADTGAATRAPLPVARQGRYRSGAHPAPTVFHVGTSQGVGQVPGSEHCVGTAYVGNTSVTGLVLQQPPLCSQLPLESRLLPQGGGVSRTARGSAGVACRTHHRAEPSWRCDSFGRGLARWRCRSRAGRGGRGRRRGRRRCSVVCTRARRTWGGVPGSGWRTVPIGRRSPVPWRWVG